MTKRVVTGFDSSEMSRRAVYWAADEAARCGCELRIVSCFTMPISVEFALGWGASEAYSAVQASAEAELAKLRTKVAHRYPDLELVTECRPGMPATALVEGRSEDDLIVVGASRHADASAFWLGSTARAVARTAPCAVAVIRGDWMSSAPERVVVGVDGSEPAERALRWAAAQADRYQVPLRLVHAWDYPYVKPTLAATLSRSDPTDLPGRALTQVQACEVMEIDAASVLERAMRAASELTNVAIDTRLVRGGAVRALLSTPAPDELLVIGSRGRGALAAAVFGSVANAVLDDATTPVVVVH